MTYPPQQPTYPPPPPSAWIDLTIQGNEMTSSMVTPEVWINGYRIPTRYGLQQVPMPPGPVHVEASLQWLRRYGQAQMDFVLQPGERIPVFYAAPFHQFTTGSIGHEKQSRKGVWALLLILGAILLLVFAAILLPVMLS